MTDKTYTIEELEALPDADLNALAAELRYGRTDGFPCWNTWSPATDRNQSREDGGAAGEIEAMKTEGTFYAVVIWNKEFPEKAFFGYCPDSTAPKLYDKRRDAVAYKNACLKAGISGAKVVRVTVTVECEFNPTER